MSAIVDCRYVLVDIEIEAAGNFGSSQSQIRCLLKKKRMTGCPDLL
jgi:hypothetical protein